MCGLRKGLIGGISKVRAVNVSVFGNLDAVKALVQEKGLFTLHIYL